MGLACPRVDAVRYFTGSQFTGAWCAHRQVKVCFLFFYGFCRCRGCCCCCCRCLCCGCAFVAASPFGAVLFYVVYVLVLPWAPGLPPVRLQDDIGKGEECGGSLRVGTAAGAFCSWHIGKVMNLGRLPGSGRRSSAARAGISCWVLDLAVRHVLRIAFRGVGGFDWRRRPRWGAFVAAQGFQLGRSALGA